MLIKYCQTIQGPHLEATAFRREMISQRNTVWWLVKSTKVQTMFWQLVKKTVLQPIALHLGRWIIKATPLDTCANTRWIGELKMKIMKCANTCWIGELKMCKYLLNWRTEDDDNEMNWREACPWWNKCTLSLKLVELWTYPGRQVTHRCERSSALSRIKH